MAAALQIGMSHFRSTGRDVSEMAARISGRAPARRGVGLSAAHGAWPLSLTQYSPVANYTEAKNVYELRSVRSGSGVRSRSR